MATFRYYQREMIMNIFELKSDLVYMNRGKAVALYDFNFEKLKMKLIELKLAPLAAYIGELQKTINKDLNSPDLLYLDKRLNKLELKHSKNADEILEYYYTHDLSSTHSQKSENLLSILNDLLSSLIWRELRINARRFKNYYPEDGTQQRYRYIKITLSFSSLIKLLISKLESEKS